MYWTLKDVPSLQAAGVSAMEFAEEARPLWAAFPTPPSTPTSNDGLGTSLYNPLLRVESTERCRIVDQTLAILLGGDADAGT